MKDKGQKTEKNLKKSRKDRIIRFKCGHRDPEGSNTFEELI